MALDELARSAVEDLQREGVGPGHFSICSRGLTGETQEVGTGLEPEEVVSEPELIGAMGLKFEEVVEVWNMH
jgi:hypothetical protein